MAHRIIILVSMAMFAIVAFGSIIISMPATTFAILSILPVFTVFSILAVLTIVSVFATSFAVAVGSIFPVRAVLAILPIGTICPVSTIASIFAISAAVPSNGRTGKRDRCEAREEGQRKFLTGLH
ncbi:MAG: hypothetical protein EP350_06570 [Alphaproteobacteria bacterium]|nr:MAG: hypothetical protein EP350_06570 [Alphaproteobacteria bacterium]